MFKIIALVVVAAIAALLIYAATRPDDFRVTRSLSIKAPPEKIFTQINDLHSWAAWSPYEKLDPAMKRTFSGAESGKGAAYAWDGNSKAGAGRMEIVDVTEPSKIVIQLDFLRPFESRSTAEFTLQTQGETTNVSWSMYGPASYISKLMGTIFNMDKMIGKAFEDGLANLKAAAES